PGGLPPRLAVLGEDAAGWSRGTRVQRRQGRRSGRVRGAYAGGAGGDPPVLRARSPRAAPRGHCAAGVAAPVPGSAARSGPAAARVPLPGGGAPGGVQAGGGGAPWHRLGFPGRGSGAARRLRPDRPAREEALSPGGGSAQRRRFFFLFWRSFFRFSRRRRFSSSLITRA